MSLPPGTRRGPYEIGDRIGAGAMGEVYRARDPRLGRDVAIKVIASTPDDDLLSRFERETGATAVLAHPNIVTVFDVGTHEGRLAVEQFDTRNGSPDNAERVRSGGEPADSLGWFRR